MSILYITNIVVKFILKRWCTISTLLYSGVFGDIKRWIRGCY